MRSAPSPTIATSSPAPVQKPPSSMRYWLSGAMAGIGLVAGLVLGGTSYQNTQQQIDTFARMSSPGTITVPIDEPARLVVYYEGDQSIGLGDLAIMVTHPTGTNVEVDPFQGELIYDTPNLTQGRAVATFDADQAGIYEVEVSGVNGGSFAVGDSVSRLALPGVLAGVAIAGLSVVAGALLWLATFLKRSKTLA